MKRFAFILFSVVALLLAPAWAQADKVFLKDGRVIEGVITREGDGFLYISYKFGEMDRNEFVLRSNIDHIERDADTATDDSKSKTPIHPDVPAPTPTPTPDSTPRAKLTPSNAPPGACKIAFITLEGEVGPEMNAGALRHSVELLSDDEPDIVVLKINSGGGALFEIQKLSDVIEKDIKPKYRVVAWIESAISAAAMTAFTSEEIYMLKEGNIGAATAFSMSGGRATAAKGEDLERIFREMERICKRGNHDYKIMRAMEVPTDLSADIDANGTITWRYDLEGQHIVSTTNKILTFNSIDAVKFGLARSVADNKDDLARALGCDSWVEVGKDADEYQQKFRNNVKQAQVRATELLQKMNIAVKSGSLSRARSFLGQLRGLVRRAPSLEVYGSPPLDRDFFKQVEEQLDAIAKKNKTRR